MLDLGLGRAWVSVPLVLLSQQWVWTVPAWLSRQRAGSHSLLTLPGTQAKAKNQNQVEELINACETGGKWRGLRWKCKDEFRQLRRIQMEFISTFPV